MKTKTGSFPIGIRQGWTDWQSDISNVISWALENGAEVIDVGNDAVTSVKQVRDAGLRVGTADLLDWNRMISSDKGVRADAVAKNTEYIISSTETGGVNFFIVMLPADPSLPAKENFGYMVESFGELMGILEETGSTISVEGWPAQGSLVCTPETYREYLKELPSKAAAVNYDPSHLIRMGIDPIRFVKEFGKRVAHVHGKDTAIMSDKVYEFGTELTPVFKEAARWESGTWRYTIPGNGCMQWSEAFIILEDKGYTGCVTIELEDTDFNGSEEGEKDGNLQGMKFLSKRQKNNTETG